jgi:hypothetical protein
MQHPQLQGRKLLIIDEEPTRAHALQVELGTAGAEVMSLMEFIMRGEATAAILASQPDTGSARALVRLLERRHVPFLIHAVEPPARVSTGRGAPFVAKPCPARMIISAMSLLLRERRKKYQRSVSRK